MVTLFCATLSIPPKGYPLLCSEKAKHCKLSGLGSRDDFLPVRVLTEIIIAEGQREAAVGRVGHKTISVVAKPSVIGPADVNIRQPAVRLEFRGRCVWHIATVKGAVQHNQRS